MFKTVAQLESQINEKLDRVVAIAEIAKQENRTYSELETGEVDSINASVETDKKALEFQRTEHKLQNDR